MDRRNFLRTGSLAMLGSLAVPSLAMPASVRGALGGADNQSAVASAMVHFGVTEADLKKVMAAALEKGGDYADLYFEHTFNNSVVLMDGKVNNCGANIDFGMGVRVLAGDQTGYAYVEGVTMEEMLRAARAAADVIEKAWDFGYMPLPDLWSLWNNNYSNNNELIFGVMQREDNWFERVNFPIGIEGGGNTGHCPTENLVESYEMQASGLPVAPDAGYEHMDPSYDSQNPYEGRDPRMYELVAQNGAWWVYDEQVECWYGGRSGKPQKNATVTGYYLRKYVDGSTSLKSEFVTSKRHVWNIMRYSEILLNFAEAMVEAYGDPNYKDGYPMSAKEAVDIVRSRVHVDMPPFPNNLTLNEFKAKLRNERRVELSFEDHRFWDIRRWKIADQTTDIYGVDITKKEDGSFSYKKVLVEKRIFKDCMYLYPIPQSERYINPELEQNPGW